MQIIDWLIVALPLVVVVVMAIFARRHLKSVADYMAGGRNAGRYLLCTARSEMDAGASGYVMMFEMFALAGFAIGWWKQMWSIVGLMVAISGFVIYRYRQTRALTLAQFCEMRYSRNFRLFTGFLGFFAGLVNFGIMPVIGARFMVYFLGMPQDLRILSVQVPTYLILMVAMLALSTYLTLAGGQITVMLTDCVQGMFSQVFYVIIAVAVLWTFSWPRTREVLMARPAGQSMVNPFDSFGVKDFNIWFVLMAMFYSVYATMAWQNSHAFNSSAINPHESRMGAILGSWRGFAIQTMMILLGVCAVTYLGQPAGAANVQRIVDTIPDARTASQMRMPIALSLILPVGIKGLLVSVILMGVLASNGMHLHSWSSIFIQDVIVPLRKRPLTTRQHLILLRGAVIGVGIFAFCFGAMFHQTEYVAMWFTITEAIFTGGAGVCIIGGLYWSRGTTAGAWIGLLTGSTLSVGGILLRQIYPQFPFNGREIGFYAALAAITSYVVVSLLTCRKPHNMDRLLHRGQYAVEGEATSEAIAPAMQSLKKRFHIHNLVGIDEHFSRSDRWVALGIFWWSVTWFLVFVVGSVWYLIHPWSATAWANYWLVTAVYLPLLIAVVTTIWFTIGCWHDIGEFFRRLRGERVNEADDGTVTRNGHGESGEAVEAGQPGASAKAAATETSVL